MVKIWEYPSRFVVPRLIGITLFHGRENIVYPLGLTNF